MAPPLHYEMHVTTIFVTHDQEEAMEVANRVVVMNKGRIEQIGAPDEVYDRPATPSCTASWANPSSWRWMSAVARCGSQASHASIAARRSSAGASKLFISA